jgi:hypothetical protein
MTGYEGYLVVILKDYSPVYQFEFKKIYSSLQVLQEKI